MLVGCVAAGLQVLHSRVLKWVRKNKQETCNGCPHINAALVTHLFAVIVCSTRTVHVLRGDGAAHL
jgi:hypothetical protein